MQCSKCGRKLKPDMTVCPSCGTGIDGKASIAQTNMQKAMKEKKKGKSSIEKTSKAIMAVFIAVAMVLIVGTIVYISTDNLRAYNAAQKSLDEGNYQQAESAFINLGNYKDSEQKLQTLREQYVDNRLAAGDYLGAQRYVSYIDNSLSYKADLFTKVTYEVAKLHEEKNPIIAAYYYEQTHDYLDADERAEQMRAKAKEIGQTMDDFNDPEPSEEDAGKNLFYKISFASFDTEKEANDYKQVLEGKIDGVSPFVNEMQGKFNVLAASITNRKDAETKKLSLEKLGYETELIVDWVKYKNSDQLSAIMEDLAKTMSVAVAG